MPNSIYSVHLYIASSQIETKPTNLFFYFTHTLNNGPLLMSLYWTHQWRYHVGAKWGHLITLHQCESHCHIMWLNDWVSIYLTDTFKSATTQNFDDGCCDTDYQKYFTEFWISTQTMSNAKRFSIKCSNPKNKITQDIVRA